MKKAYAAPALATSGNVVRDTRIGEKDVSEDGLGHKPNSAGDIGFYL